MIVGASPDEPLRLNVSAPSLILLMGVPGCGKSTFAHKHFRATEVVSSDYCRALVGDDEADQTVSVEAFSLLHFLIEKRLKLARVCVVDATNVYRETRRRLLEIAGKAQVKPTIIVLDYPLEFCIAQDRARERIVGEWVIRKCYDHLRENLPLLESEGFELIVVVKTPAELEAIEFHRTPPPTDRRSDSGPFDVIGDVHGCFRELCSLLLRLGYALTPKVDVFGRPTFSVSHPSGRRVIFLGDLVDRGPATPEVLRLVMEMVKVGQALCVRGNHDDKLARFLSGVSVSIAHGLEKSIQQLKAEPPEFITAARDFLNRLEYYYWLDGGELIVAHAGLKEDLHGKAGPKVRAFSLYGETNGEIDSDGLPIRLNWAKDYRGKATVIYGHTPTNWPEWQNRTLCIDTGCVFGGKLTALRWPEAELVSVQAERAYCSTRGESWFIKTQPSSEVGSPSDHTPSPSTPDLS